MKDMLFNLQKDIDKKNKDHESSRTEKLRSMCLRSLIAIKTRATLRIVTIVASQDTYNETVGVQKQRKVCTLMEKKEFKPVRGTKKKITRQRVQQSKLLQRPKS